MPNADFGTISEAVRALHTELARRRFHVPRDEVARCYFGPGTRQAVIQFQRGAGLSLTGAADPRTMSALGVSLAVEVAAAEPAPPEPEPLPRQAVNANCPWSGKPVQPEGVLTHEDRVMGFCSRAHGDKFALAISHFADQRGSPLEHRTCPWSGRRVRPDATLVYDGETVGFCTPAHRDQFQAALTYFASPETASAPAPSDGADSMMPMEEVADTTYVPPLVDATALAQFCQAIQTYADGQGLHDAAATALNRLQVRLAGLRDMASLARLTLVGHPLSFTRFEDELRCLADAFPCEKLEPGAEDEECCERSPEQVVLLAAAVDLFSGATFVWKHDPPRRDRTILAIVRAIEEAIAFPAAFAAEAAVFLGASDSAVSPMYAALVIANATERLLACGTSCVPLLPSDIRRRLESLALAWIEANPVTAFFEAIDGPEIQRIVRWETDKREGTDPMRIGDTLAVLVHQPCELENYRVVFTPRQPATDGAVIDRGFQVRVPQQARTGPVIVVPNTPDFDCVIQLLTRYQQQYPDEINASIFALARIDFWAFPLAYRHPCVTIASLPANVTATAFTTAGPLADGQTIAVGQTVSIRHRVEPAGAGSAAAPAITAQGGIVTPTGRPDVLLFTPTVSGSTSVQLAWPDTTVTVPISVA
jgi:hypothetical protein